MFRKARVAAALLSIAGAFYAGFQVASWRAGARETRAVEARELAYREAVDRMAAEAAADNELTHAREFKLAELVAVERQQAEVLRREIQDRPVIRRTVQVPVAGECAAVPAVDWSVFVDVYNRAATGAPAADAADTRDAGVSARTANVAF